MLPPSSRRKRRHRRSPTSRRRSRRPRLAIASSDRARLEPEIRATMTPAEHEATIQALFHAEAAEHFQAIRACLDSADADRGGAKDHLQAALRAAHSLKGAARMAGHLGLERMVHDWESWAAA